jgi:hypothetical protein
MTAHKIYTAAEQRHLNSILSQLYIGNRVVAHQFLPTLQLAVFEPFLRTGQLRCLPGQHVQGISGRKARLLRAGGGEFAASWAGRGDDFDFYTTRFQRALWRHVNAHVGSLERALLSAPDTMPTEEIVARLKARAIKSIKGELPNTAIPAAA